MTGPIYTRRGDAGETSLVGGARVSKYHPRVEAYGTVDEANAAVGLVRASLEVAAPEEAEVDRMLDFVQHRLFNCSSALATPSGAETEHTPHITDADIARLEGYIDELTEATGELEHFVLPGGCEQSARLHVARTVARRAERRIVELADAEPVDDRVRAFLNRLSDLLFALARYANKTYQGGDVYWNPEI
jgi:cob(I)alamin adenosyltransferase